MMELGEKIEFFVQYRVKGYWKDDNPTLTTKKEAEARRVKLTEVFKLEMKDLRIIKRITTIEDLRNAI